MKRILAVLLLPILLGCATATQMATTIGMEAGVLTEEKKQVIDQTAMKTEKAARPVTESEEYYIGRGVAARILRQYELHRHAGSVRYVNHVGGTLTINSPRPYTYGGYHFALLDTDEINAFACPGGIIFVTRGMLRLVQNEDELAAVLAHEIAHVSQKHGLRSISKARWTEVVTTVAGGVAREYSGAEMETLINLFEGTIDDVFQTLVVSGYDRASEYEADALAIKCLDASGYDSREFLGVLGRLARAKKQTTGGIFATHPDIEGRIEKVKVLCQAEEEAPLPRGRINRFRSISAYW